VLDLQMPDMNGVEFLKALQQRPAHRNTPVVVATSEAESSPLRQEVRRLGVASRERGGARAPATRHRDSWT
jgi:CheY-like chemotaxis protein